MTLQVFSKKFGYFSELSRFPNLVIGDLDLATEQKGGP